MERFDPTREELFLLNARANVLLDFFWNKKKKNSPPGIPRGTPRREFSPTILGNIETGNMQLSLKRSVFTLSYLLDSYLSGIT